MVFRPPARETIHLLRALLQELEKTETESIDLIYLRRIMLERIEELEAAQKLESSMAEISFTKSEAA